MDTIRAVHVPMSGRAFFNQHPGWWAFVEDPGLKEGQPLRFSMGDEQVDAVVERVLPPGKFTNSAIWPDFHDWWVVVYKPSGPARSTEEVWFGPVERKEPTLEEVERIRAAVVPAKRSGYDRILAERERQKTVEGFSPQRDREMNDDHSLLKAARCYADYGFPGTPTPGEFPWRPSWWKPSSRERSLEKAGALFLAEAERLGSKAAAGGLLGGELARQIEDCNRYALACAGRLDNLAAGRSENDEVKCRRCGRMGSGLDEFVSPHTGLCAECSKESQPINLYEMHKRMTAHLFPAFTSEDERFLALALCGEAGELANLVKKRWRDGADLKEEARDEIADVRVYLELLAKVFDVEGSKLDQRVQEKLAKVVARVEAKRSKA